MNEWRHGGASFSDCEKYRYHLWRQRTEVEPMRRLLICMLNPSTAGDDPDDNDPTVRKCCGFAERLEFDRFDIVNMFPWRTAYPTELREAQLLGNDIVQLEINHEWITRHVRRATLVVAAWGANARTWRSYAARVTRLLADGGRPVMCWGRTKGSHPQHPLMLPYATELEPFEYPQRAGRHDED